MPSFARTQLVSKGSRFGLVMHDVNRSPAASLQERRVGKAKPEPAGRARDPPVHRRGREEDHRGEAEGRGDEAGRPPQAHYRASQAAAAPALRHAGGGAAQEGGRQEAQRCRVAP